MRPTPYSWLRSSRARPSPAGPTSAPPTTNASPRRAPSVPPSATRRREPCGDRTRSSGAPSRTYHSVEPYAASDSGRAEQARDPRDEQILADGESHQRRQRVVVEHEQRRVRGPKLRRAGVTSVAGSPFVCSSNVNWVGKLSGLIDRQVQTPHGRRREAGGPSRRRRRRRSRTSRCRPSTRRPIALPLGKKNDAMVALMTATRGERSSSVAGSRGPPSAARRWR